MKRAMHRLWARRSLITKVIGLALLLAYFFGNPITIQWQWVGAYLAVVLGVGIGYGLIVNPLLERMFPSQRVDLTPYGANLQTWVTRRPLWELLLLPGEDGFFFVPLLWFGITPISAAVSATIFAAAHYPQFPAKHCAVKFVFLFCIALFVLPHGLASVIVGHLLIDALAFAVASKLFPIAQSTRLPWRSQ